MTTLEVDDGLNSTGEEIGRGPTGRIYKFPTSDGGILARKVAFLSSSLDWPSYEDHVRWIWEPLTHNNVIKLECARQETVLENGNECIVMCKYMEYAPHGSIKSLYEDRRNRGERLSELEIQGFARETANGLNYIHEKGIVHGNLKCSNILLGGDGESQVAKIGDLASAARAGTSIASKFRRIPFTTPFQKCIFWTSPEVIKDSIYTSPAAFPADVYSYGATVLEMYTSNHPFPDLTWEAALREIQGGGVPSLPLNSDTFHAVPSARDLIVRCLCTKPEKRPTAKEILSHPYILGRLDGDCFGRNDSVPYFLGLVKSDCEQATVTDGAHAAE